jgi:hypothetical protein
LNIGNPEEAVYYNYRIKILGKNGNEIIFRGKVRSLDEPRKDVMTNVLTIISDVQAKHLRENGKVKFAVSLSSDKEEYKDENVESGISDDEED